MSGLPGVPADQRPGVRLLHLEDEPDFCRLVKDFLTADGLEVEAVLASDLKQFKALLEQGPFDVILADYQLGSGTGLEALRQAAQRCPETPFLLLSGMIGEDAGVRALKEGATDYIPKQSLARLPAVVRRAIERASEKARLSQAESSLDRRERYFQALTENSLDVLSIISNSGLIQYTSGSARQTLGYDPAELSGQNVFSFLHPDDVPAAKDAFQRALQNPGLRVQHEVRFRRRDETWCDLEVIGQSRVDEPEIGGVVLNSRDISERKRVQETLRLQAAALESAANAIVLTNRSGLVIWANPAFERLTGYSRSEVVGRNLRFLRSGQHGPEFYEDLWNTVLSGRVWHSELVNRHKDGHLYTEETTITPVLDERGTVTHFIAVKQDVSERKRAEALLEQTHQQLLSASKQAAVAEFATSILHNVGNVLNSVGVASDCLAESLKKSTTRRLPEVVHLLAEHRDELGPFFKEHPKGKLVLDYLGQLGDKLVADQARAIEEMNQLQKSVEHVKAIITLQQSAAKGAATPEPIDPAELFDEVLKMSNNALIRRNIRVVKQYARTSPVLLQKHRILQILLNLIRNAIQACEASENEAKFIRVGIQRVDSLLRMSVADNGVGIESKNLSQIFSLGFTTKKDGHGFGLHGAWVDAKDMGGSLTVQSAGAGCGACFVLELPV